MSVRSLRYYEQQGLLEADRAPSGQRTYAEGAVERVQLIQQLYGAGVPSRAIVDLLPCVTTGVVTRSVFDQLQHQRDTVAGRIQDLRQAQRRLDELVRHALELGVHDD